MISVGFTPLSKSLKLDTDNGVESFMEINSITKLCAVLGQPIHHSASPAMQNAAINELKLNWRYLAFEVDPKDLAEVIKGAKSMGFVGLNLTVPHKLIAMELVDCLDESARVWGAVNTIRFEVRGPDDDWIPLAKINSMPTTEVRAKGFNTDADAIIRTLSEDAGCNVKGLRVLLLGAGGAGRVAALRLAAEGVGVLYLVNRTQQKCDQIAQEINRTFPNVQAVVGYPNSPVDLVINATSLGLNPEDSLPWDGSRYSLLGTAVAFDMIYRPSRTPFLTMAEKAGCRTANGLGMLLFQGAKALEIWSGQSAPVDVMRRALHENIYGRTTHAAEVQN